MKTKPLSSYGASIGVEAYDIDWNCQEEVIKLGKLCASKCIVFVAESLPVKTLNEAMSEWGDASVALIHQAVVTKQVKGKHWKEIFLNLCYPNRLVGEEIPKNASVISYRKDKKNRPIGFFQNGELDWHSDQCALDDGQRIIGLQSLSGSKNSQTQFLCTFDAYQSLSSEMQSMVKELVVKHKWVDNLMAPGLNYLQNLTLRYGMVPIDGMETRLYSETASGLPGMKIPSHSFDGFVGMSRAESDRIIKEIKKATYKEKYIYTHNWQDGQIVFMDQEITLHKRPTNIQDGDQRTMARSIFYVNKIFNSQKSQRLTQVRYKGVLYSVDDFIHLVNEDRKRAFEESEKEKIRE